METLKIVKIGGNIIDNEVALNEFLKHFSTLEGPKILVHGGGKRASEMAYKMQVEVKIKDGRRITNNETLKIITMVYAGEINKLIVAKLQGLNCNALGLSGADGNSIEATQRLVKDIDFGFVGEIVKVNAPIIKMLLGNEIVTIFCALTHNKKGQLLNVNADTIASELAIALTTSFKTELYYCFEKKGVLANQKNEDSVIETMNSFNYRELIQNKTITEGMLPKLNNCFHALLNNVSKVCLGQPDMVFNSNSICTTIEK